MKTPRLPRSNPTPSARARLVCALIGWVLALALQPLAAQRFGNWLLLLTPVVGAYFVSWIGMLRHELWHRYVDGVDNRFFYRVTCFALCLDPETYRLSHASHHRHANTDRDMQLYPEDFLRNPRRSRFQFVMELLLGNLAWEIATAARLRRQGLLKGATMMANLPGRLVLPGLLALFHTTVAPEAARMAAVHFVVMFWSGSLMTRHNQWLQHLGIFATGDSEARDLLTRNLRNQTILERLVNFLNHDDSVAHTYHHTEPRTYARLDSALHPAPNHVQITLPEYAATLMAFCRQLFGKAPAFSVQHLGRSTGTVTPEDSQVGASPTPIEERGHVRNDFSEQTPIFETSPVGQPENLPAPGFRRSSFH